ncbi:uncharacterized protein LOC103312118 [Tribolium castaneum]|uniref:Uncharacterized protein n=1 Tax=Tribolium castaneum TaxID=7070 RepID=D6WNV4_TRICA|nr:PREDICTED: extensin [Tribolium castaneum]EFA04390.1 hypothetical protein TcasGA2_TC014688 [Tribolium castaneum]|eukprot:XP_008194341.1 PREDICTED: extensin [Tribolium castaneum]
MKAIIAVIFAFAVGCNALYPLPEPVVPSVVYGVPEEPKAVITPITTDYAYTFPAVQPVEVHHEEIVAPAAPLLTVEEPKPVVAPVVPTFVPPFAHPYAYPYSPLPHFYSNPFLPNYAPSYPVPFPGNELFVPPQIHAPIYVAPEEQVAPAPFSYAYSYPHITTPHLTYAAPELHQPLADLAAAQVLVSSYNYTVSAPAFPTFVGAAPAVLPAVPVAHQEPLVVSYDYHIPQVAEKVVVQEIPAPVVPQTVYGLPQ